MQQYTIMIRNSNGGPDPIRASVKPKTPKHTPVQNVKNNVKMHAEWTERERE